MSGGFQFPQPYPNPRPPLPVPSFGTSPSEDVYVGVLVQGKKCGFGLWLDRQGQKFVSGEFMDDKLQGVALSNGADGKVFLGGWRKGKKHGCGRVNVPGKIYVGEFADGHRHGVGRVDATQGEFKIGHFVEGDLEGYGEYTIPSKGYKYQGQFSKGVPSGLGTESTRSSRYAGNFLRGGRDGQGIAVHENGDEHIGYWANGVKHGVGYEKTISGEAFLGNFALNKREGVGMLDLKAGGGKYTGHFHKGLMSRLGRLRTLNGLYIGQWRNNKKNGMGYEKAGEVIYFGQWVEGKKQGFGYLITPKQEYKGEFFEDQRHGKGIVKIDYSEKIVNYEYGVEVPVINFKVDDILSAFEHWDAEKFFNQANQKLEAIERELAEKKVKIEMISSSLSPDFEEDSTNIHSKFKQVQSKLAKCEAEFNRKKAVFMDHTLQQNIDLGVFKILLTRQENNQYTFDIKELESEPEPTPASPSKHSSPGETETHLPLFSGRMKRELANQPERIVPQQDIRATTSSVLSRKASFGNDRDLMDDYSPSSLAHSPDKIEPRSSKYVIDKEDTRSQMFDRSAQSLHIKDLSPKSNQQNIFEFGREGGDGPEPSTINKDNSHFQRQSDEPDHLRNWLTGGHGNIEGRQLSHLEDFGRFNHQIEGSPAGKYLLSFRDEALPHRSQGENEKGSERDQEPIPNPYATERNSREEDFSSHMDDFDELPPPSDSNRHHYSGKFHQDLPPKPERQSSPPVRHQTPERDFSKHKSFNESLLPTEEKYRGSENRQGLFERNPDGFTPGKDNLDLGEIIISNDIIKGEVLMGPHNQHKHLRVFQGRKDEIVLNIGDRLYAIDTEKLLLARTISLQSTPRVSNQNASFVVPNRDTLTILDANTNQLKHLDHELNIVQISQPASKETVFRAGAMAGHNSDIRYKHSLHSRYVLWIREYPGLEVVNSSTLEVEASLKDFFLLREQLYLQPMALCLEEGIACGFCKGSDGNCYLKWVDLKTAKVSHVELSWQQKEVWVDLALVQSFAVAIGYNRAGGSTKGIIRIFGLKDVEIDKVHFIEKDKLSCVREIGTSLYFVVGGFDKSYICHVDSPDVLRVVQQINNFSLRTSSSPTDFTTLDEGLLVVFEKESRLFASQALRGVGRVYSQGVIEPPKPRVADVVYSPQRGEHSPPSPVRPIRGFDVRQEALLTPYDLGEGPLKDVRGLALRHRGSELVLRGGASLGSLRLDERGNPLQLDTSHLHRPSIVWRETLHHTRAKVLEAHLGLHMGEMITLTSNQQVVFTIAHEGIDLVENSWIDTSRLFYRRFSELHVFEENEFSCSLIHRRFYNYDEASRMFGNMGLYLVYDKSLTRFCGNSILGNGSPTLVFYERGSDQRGEINFSHQFSQISGMELDLQHKAVITCGGNGRVAQLCAVKFDETLKPLASMTKSCDPFVRLKRVPGTNTLMLISKHSLFIYDFDPGHNFFELLRELRVGSLFDLSDFIFVEENLYFSAESANKLFRSKLSSYPSDYDYKAALDIGNMILPRTI